MSGMWDETRNSAMTTSVDLLVKAPLALLLAAREIRVNGWNKENCQAAKAIRRPTTCKKETHPCTAEAHGN